jgi:hypothetical protein
LLKKQRLLLEITTKELKSNMALGKRKGPGDKVARLEKKGEKFVSKLEKAKAAGPKEGPNKKVMKLASKAGKAFGKAARAKGNVVTESAKERASTIGSTDMFTRGIGGPIGSQVGSFQQAVKQKRAQRVAPPQKAKQK